MNDPLAAAGGMGHVSGKHDGHAPAPPILCLPPQTQLQRMPRLLQLLLPVPLTQPTPELSVKTLREGGEGGGGLAGMVSILRPGAKAFTITNH